KGQLPFHCLKNITFGINDIAVIKKLIFSKTFFRSYLLIYIKLETGSSIITLKEGSLTKIANHQNAGSNMVFRSFADFLFRNIRIFLMKKFKMSVRFNSVFIWIRTKFLQLLTFFK